MGGEPVAAYTNSLILNKVYVPQYGIPEDLQALQTFEDAMPGYQVLGFDDSQSNPWYGEDALHCRTIGIFNPEMIHISHKSIRSDEIFNNNNLIIEVEVANYDNNSSLESVKMYWKYSSEDGPFGEVVLNLDSGNLYIGEFLISIPIH